MTNEPTTTTPPPPSRDTDRCAPPCECLTTDLCPDCRLCGDCCPDEQGCPYADLRHVEAAPLYGAELAGLL